jgi:hypothetical protein
VALVGVSRTPFLALRFAGSNFGDSAPPRGLATVCVIHALYPRERLVFFGPDAILWARCESQVELRFWRFVSGEI